ncbi:aspartate carbamoyltransferase catalytic subunit [Trueperella sp. LYQ143]|uniref:aspartate carbamoyltransferase catalytic subunit n=1 Tax=unclassified Trueperella TaxID=2630174 RepID=UPI00398365DA
MKHLLDCTQLCREEALEILDIAQEMAASQDRPHKKLPTLRGKLVANLFFENSTRTRLSFETAAKRLSADVLTFTASGSSVAKGESLKDTALTLAAMGADAFIIRHSSSGAAARLAHAGWVDIPVINAGDGTHAHPTQALLDAFTVRQHRYPQEPKGRDLNGVHVVIVGDILHSRVARSNVELLHTLGAEITLVAPPTLLPSAMTQWPVNVTYDLDAALASAPDAVMMLRVQKERMLAAGGGYFPSAFEYHRLYGLTPQRLAHMDRRTIIMHPGPMNRGLEISAEAADCSQSVAVRQVANGVAIRMAVLYALLAQGSETEGR